jgi:hypothetical protein
VTSGTVLVDGAQAAASTISRPALRSCQPTDGNTLLGGSYRELRVSRNGKDLRYSFARHPDDSKYGITKYVLYVLHPTGKAKKGDSRFGLWGTACRSVVGSEDLSWKPQSVKSIECKGSCDWLFSGTISKIRDEANAVILVGLDRHGRRVAFHFNAFGERLGGTWSGKWNRLKCNVAAVGLPVAETMFVASRATLSTLSMADQRASSGLLLLDLLAVEADVSSTGDRIAGHVGFTHNGQVSDEKLRATAELAVSHALSAAAGKQLNIIAESVPKRIARGKYVVDFSLTLPDWFAAYQKLTQIESRSKENLDLCKIWR